MATYREGLPPLPVYMQKLPLDPRGFPVPWFTPWLESEQRWAFEAASQARVTQAVREQRCWICGLKLFRNLAFVIGPMCAINRTTSEPPSHVECANYAAQACPFLTKPRMRRLPQLEGAESPGGIMLERNPGVCLVWITRSFRVRPGVGLFEIGDPIRVEAWAEGREATAAEVSASILSGLPELERLANGDPAGLEELSKRRADAWELLRLP